MSTDKSTHIKPHKLMLNCKQATELIILNEFEPLFLKQRFALWFHLIVCKVCALFKKQSLEITEVIKKNERENNLVLSLEKKQELSRLLNELK